METRKKFFGMDAQERDAFFANEEVKSSFSVRGIWRFRSARLPVRN